MTEHIYNEKYMLRAIELAKRGTGRTLPNPLVGAVIVKDGRVIGEGFHEYYGGLHAERNAFAKKNKSAEGADMYVTLEPCAHHGKTPPCTEAIIENGIKRVFIGSSDPNPKVSGKGVRCLEEAGIEVVSGVLKEECDKINHIFFHYITTGLPYVMLKYAMSADGKIATKTGDSKWISSEESRNTVQQMRNEYPAIMVGIGTVLKDDPSLTCRLEGGVSPVRVVCDSSLKIPTDCELVKTAKDIPTFVACALPGVDNGIIVRSKLCEEAASKYLMRYGDIAEIFDGENLYFPYANVTGEVYEKIKLLLAHGVGIVNVCGADRKTDLRELMRILGESGVSGIMVEGGGELNFSLLQEKLVNEVNVFLGSKLIGGSSKTPVGGVGVERISEAFSLRLQECIQMGDDVFLRYEVPRTFT